MKNILLVDDDPDVRQCMSELLSCLKCLTISVSSGKAALEVLRISRSFDLILADYKMPGMDGLEFIRRVRETMPLLPVILMTGYENIEVYLKAQNLGVMRYVRKPIHLRDIQSILQHLADKEREGAQTNDRAQNSTGTGVLQDGIGVISRRLYH